MLTYLTSYLTMFLTVLLTEIETVSSSTIMDILRAITGVFSVSQIVAMVAGILGVSMTFVFLWWGVRKGGKVIIKAVKSGKFSM